MRIVDRYIFQSITAIFICTLSIFCSLFIVIDIAGHLDNYIDLKVPFQILLEYYLSYLPIIISETCSIAALIAVSLTYSHLNTTNELIVLRTSGLNFWQIAKPAIYFGLIVSCLIFVISERLIPQSEIKSKKIKQEHLVKIMPNKKEKKDVIKNLTFYGLKNRLYFINEFDPNKSQMTGITILGLDKDQNVVEKIVAWKGQWTGIAWEFINCQISAFDSGDFKSPVKIGFYEEPRIMDIKETPKDFLRQRLDVITMNIRDLSDYIAKFKNSGATRAIESLRVDLFQKYAYPLGPIIIILVGLPVSMMTHRRKAITFTSIGIAITIGFLFYVCNAVGVALGKGGVVPPWLAAFFAPLVFSAVALYLIKVKFE